MTSLIACHNNNIRTSCFNLRKEWIEECISIDKTKKAKSVKSNAFPKRNDFKKKVENGEGASETKPLIENKFVKSVDVSVKKKVKLKLVWVPKSV